VLIFRQSAVVTKQLRHINFADRAVVYEDNHASAREVNCVAHVTGRDRPSLDYVSVLYTNGSATVAGGGGMKVFVRVHVSITVAMKMRGGAFTGEMSPMGTTGSSSAASPGGAGMVEMASRGARKMGSVEAAIAAVSAASSAMKKEPGTGTGSSPGMSSGTNAASLTAWAADNVAGLRMDRS
jgi:hypothetical protein